MPGWLNAPSWAEWLQFCRTRGWMFVSEQPHVYSDGDMTADVGRMQPASEVPGVIFFRNDRKYSGSSAPHWVCDRRAALARVGGAA